MTIMIAVMNMVLMAVMAIFVLRTGSIIYRGARASKNKAKLKLKLEFKKRFKKSYLDS